MVFLKYSIILIGNNFKHKPHPAIEEHINLRLTPFTKIFDPIQLLQLCDQEYTRVYEHLQAKEPQLFQNPELSLCVKRYEQMRNQILSREAPHREQLISLAIQVISEIYDIPEGQLRWKVDFNLENQIEPAEQGKEELDIDPDRMEFLLAEIKKRIILNTLAHGSSMHIWKSSHHIVSLELKKLSPILPVLYDAYTAILGFLIWQSNPDQMQIAMDQGNLLAQGINKIKFDEDEIEIEVEAVNFPAMLHEVNKAAIDLVICHGLPEDVSEDELKFIYQEADKYKDEFWHYLVSPSLWTRLLLSLKVTTQELPDCIMKIAQLDLNKLDHLFQLLADDKDAENFLKQCLK